MLFIAFKISWLNKDICAIIEFSICCASFSNFSSICKSFVLILRKSDFEILSLFWSVISRVSFSPLTTWQNAARNSCCVLMIFELDITSNSRSFLLLVWLGSTVKISLKIVSAIFLSTTSVSLFNSLPTVWDTVNNAHSKIMIKNLWIEI